MSDLILIVDDEPKIVKLARDYLERGGFQVTTAANGPTALAIAKADKPDLIVLDLNLPGMDRLGCLPPTTTRIRCANHHAHGAGRRDGPAHWP